MAIAGLSLFSHHRRVLELNFVCHIIEDARLRFGMTTWRRRDHIVLAARFDLLCIDPGSKNTGAITLSTCLPQWRARARLDGSLDGYKAGSDLRKRSGRPWGIRADGRSATGWRGGNRALAVLELGQQAANAGMGVVVRHRFLEWRHNVERSGA